MDGVEIRRIGPDELAEHLEALAAVLHDCVAGGAGVGYMDGFTLEEARAEFDRFTAEVERGNRFLLAAFLDGTIVGTVQVITTLPPNQPHRGEITKMLVHRSARNRGIGQRLMERAEEEARAEGKTLLMLDTVTGSPADRLYRRLGWVSFGIVPGHALLPNGEPSDTTFFWKEI